MRGLFETRVDKAKPVFGLMGDNAYIYWDMVIGGSIRDYTACFVLPIISDLEIQCTPIAKQVTVVESLFEYECRQTVEVNEVDKVGTRQLCNGMMSSHSVSFGGIWTERN